jgi:triosephosphate isomerase
MARKPIIAGNWKLNNLVSDSVELANEIRESLKTLKEKHFRKWLLHLFSHQFTL